MDTKTYVENALKTESKDFESIKNRMGTEESIRLLHAGIGLATEAGEFLDALKTHVFYGRELDRTNLKEEIGDIFWYCAIIADELNVEFDEVMTKNIAKLKARFGEKFSEDGANNRDLDSERKTLETEAHS